MTSPFDKEADLLHTAVILAALDNEFDQVRTHLQNTKVVIGESGREYWEGSIALNPDGTGESAPWRILLHEGGRDQTNALKATEDAARDWTPDAILFVGVAGGRPGKTRHLEVVVPSEIAYYGIGKKVKGGTAHWIKAEELQESDLYRAAKIVRVEQDGGNEAASWTRRLVHGPLGNRLASDGILKTLKARMAPIASGNYVETDPDGRHWQDVIKAAYRIEAVETEGHGFITAKCFGANGRPIPRLMVRGISDLLGDKNLSPEEARAQDPNRPAYLDTLEDAERQRIAAAAAATFALQVLVRYGEHYLRAKHPASQASQQFPLPMGHAVGGPTTALPTPRPDQLAAFFAGVHDLNSETASRLAEQSKRLGITEASLKAFFAILREQDDIRPEDLPCKLVEIATRHMELLERLDVLRTESPENRQRVDEARAAIERGDYTRAEILLTDVERTEAAAVERADRLAEEARETANHHRRAQAEARGERARLCMLRLDYLTAADHYHAAAEALPEADCEERVRYFWKSADAFQRHGDEKGDNDSLIRAVELYQRAIALTPRNLQPDNWAGLHNNLGNALSRLGNRVTDTTRLEEAVLSYKRSLLEFTRERCPLDWAMTQNNLGNALQNLGERENSTARMEEAVTAFNSALLERTRERVPLKWAMTQNNLGNALRGLGERETGTTRLEKAVSAFNNALLERTRERVPLKWATTQNNLGVALQSLGERESTTTHLEEAVSAYKNALLEYTRERVPLDWAMTQNNIGNALRVIAERENNRLKAEEALNALELALAVRTEARASYYIDQTTRNLARARETLARLQSSGP